MFIRPGAPPGKEETLNRPLGIPLFISWFPRSAWEHLLEIRRVIVETLPPRPPDPAAWVGLDTACVAHVPRQSVGTRRRENLTILLISNLYSLTSPGG